MSRIRAFQRLGIAAAVALVLGLVPLTFASANGGLYVGPGGGAGPCAEPLYATIQEAVDASSAGETINICAGTYNLTAPITSDHSIGLQGGGAKSTIIDGSNDGSPVQLVNVDGNIEVGNLTLRNGRTSGDGGALYATGAISINRVEFINNSAGGGGAVYSWDAVTISGSTFVGNSASAAGGAVYSFDGVIINESTFVANSARMGGAVLAANVGIYNSTFAGNVTSRWGVVVGATITSANSIISASTGGNCHGTVVDEGGSISTDASCDFDGAGSMTSVNPASVGLQALADNGGQTRTMALGLGSVAINDARDANCGSSDQRGLTRPVGTHCDSGAFEAQVASIAISPSGASASADDSQQYWAEGFDIFGNDLGDITGGTDFTIDGDPCDGVYCGSTESGNHTIVATFNALTDSTNLYVYPAELNSIVISPSSKTVAAGTAQAYTAEGFDRFGNTRGDITGSTSFSMSGAGDCEGTACSSTVPGDYTITGWDGEFSDTASLHVNPEELDHIVISPSSATITTDGSKSYAAEGYDTYGNDLGDVTEDTTFSIDGGGSCTGNVCSATVPDEYTVTANDGGLTDTASLTVNVGALASITISPSSTTIAAGEWQSYSAEGFDQFGNSRGDVTESTNFAIDGSGDCSFNDCGSQDADGYTVTGTDGLFSDTASLTVIPADLDYIVISPSSSEITTDGSQTYTAEGFDTYGNTRGDVTGATTFSINGVGSCEDNVCTADEPGEYTVTANDDGNRDWAELTVNVGAIDHIVISPSGDTITTDDTTSYTADGYDQYDNYVGDVTSSTVFTITGAGSCSGSDCGSHTPGDYTVTGTKGAMTDTAGLHVNVGALDYISISPNSSTITTDGSQTYTVTGFDQYGNSRGNYTDVAHFSIDGSGWCLADYCGSHTPGDYTVTASVGGFDDSADLMVNPGALDYIEISPSFKAVTADDTQTFTAEGFDQYGNSLGDVTEDTTFSISGSGSCTDNTCGSTTVGEYTVTANDDGNKDYAELDVEIGTLTSITISPSEATIKADDTQSYTSTGHDANGNTIDVTSSTIFSIGESECSGNVCGSTTPGDYTVNGDKGLMSDTADLTVVPGDLHHIVISPSSSVVTAGTDQAYTAEGFDQFGNSRGDVTSATEFTINGGASCDANDCGSTTPGFYTVTGNDDDFTDTASLQVTTEVLNYIVISPSSSTITAGGSQTYTVEGFDRYGNSRGDVTGSASLSIDGGGDCNEATCGSTVAGDHTVTASIGAIDDTASLHVNAEEIDYIVISPTGSSITTDGHQTYSAEAYDTYDNDLGDVTGQTNFSIGVGGWCEDNICGSDTPGDFTVTANDDGLTDSTSLHVDLGNIDYIEISPTGATVSADDTQTFTAEGFDSHGNSRGDVTAETSFSIDEGGSCTLNVCGSTTKGDYTVSANDDGLTDSTTLHVVTGDITHVVLSPKDATAIAGDTQTYTLTGYDQYENSLDVTDSTTFTIAGLGSTCTDEDCVSTLVGDHTVTGDYSEMTDTGVLHVTVAPLYDIVISPNTTTVTVATPVTYTVEGFDKYGNSRGDVTESTDFTVFGGTCIANVCSSNSTGVHWVIAENHDLLDAAALHTTAGPLSYITISPSTATVTADESQNYEAEAFDEFGNSRGTVTGSTAFSVAGGTCTGAMCYSTTPGEHLVTGTFSGHEGTANLTVSIGTLVRIVVTPDGDSITAGGSKTFAATGYDAYDNSIDVTGTTTFGIAGGGSCTGADCTSTVAGDHTVTGTKGLLSDTATLHVDAGALDHIVVSPDGNTITAGGSQVFTAEAFDSYDNTLGDVTGTTTFGIAGGGSCTGASCTTTVSGDHAVTGTKGAKSDTATLHVDAGELDHIVISPDSATVAAGTPQAYTAEAFDSYGNSRGDVTSSTTFSVVGGSCEGASCTSTAAGDHGVTGNDGGYTDGATLHVTIATLTSIVVSPDGASIVAGGSQTYAATGYDTYGNSIDVTGTTVFTVATGSCTGAACASTVPGDHTVTGTKGLLSDTTTLHVDAGSFDHLVIGPDTATITAGGSQAYTATAYDAFDNSLGDVTGTTTFGIAGGGSCTGATCTSTVAGDHTVTGTKGVKTDTASLQVNAGALDHIVVSPDGNTITAGGSQAFTAEAFDSYDNTLGDVTGTTTFGIAGGGSCTGATCTSTVAGDHTVTGTKGAFSDTATLHVGTAGLASVVISPDSATITAGGTQAYTAEGFDGFGNSTGDITGTTTFTIAGGGSCTGAVCGSNLPGDHVVTGAKSGHQDTATLHVNVGAPHHYTVTGLPSPFTPSGTGSVTVTIRDSVGNTVTTYTGTVHFTSTDGAATTPYNYTFVAGDHGTHTFANGVTLVTEGTQSITATDTVTNSITGSQTGIVVGYVAATYHAISPARILDSRATASGITNIGLSGVFTAGNVRTLQVTGAHYIGGGSSLAVPLGATAITGNLTVVGESATGLLALGPTMTSTGDVTTLNFVNGDIVANNVTVGLSAGGALQIVYRSSAGATANVIFDVTGYFTPDTNGATYHLVDPGRVLDTRPTGAGVTNIGLVGKFQTGVVRPFDIVGVTGLGWSSAKVPAGATAVTGNVTVVNATTDGHLTVGPTLTSAPATSTVNVKSGKTRANGVTVQLAAGKLSIVWVGNSKTSSADVIFDVTGYFTADQSGLAFHPIVPSRVVNTSTSVGLPGVFSNNVSRPLTIGGTGQVASGAGGIAGNITLVGPTSSGYAFAAPSLSGFPQSSTVNSTAGVTAANGFDVALDGSGRLVLVWEGATGSTTNLQLDITGYWK